jgi:hypothetical protein|tara:strand:- start:309 stop:542 length:234 start_codon:yes stop_codon:yes gene_type:complete
MIDPRNMTVNEWTDAMTYQLERYGTVGKLMNTSDWQGWGLGVVSFFEVGKQNPPNPLEYDDWLEWAFAFTRAVQLSD